MNKLLNNLLGMYKQAKLNKKAEEVVYDSDLIAQVLSMTKNQKKDEFSIVTLSPEKDKVLGVKYIKKDEVYDYKPNQNEYALVMTRDTGFADTDYQLQPMIMVVRSWNEGRKFYATKKNQLNKKAEEDLIAIGWGLYTYENNIKANAEDDGRATDREFWNKINNDIAKVESWFLKEGYKQFFTKVRDEGHGKDSELGGTAFVTEEQLKNFVDRAEGMNGSFTLTETSGALEFPIDYDETIFFELVIFVDEKILDDLNIESKRVSKNKKLSSKEKAMRKRADLKSSIEEFDKAWEKHEENFFKDYQQTLLTEYKGNLTKATQDLINSFERKLPKETLYKLLKEYIDRPSFEKIEEKDLQEAQQLVENFNKTNNEYEKNKKTIEQKIEQRLRNFYEMGYRDYKYDKDSIKEEDAYWNNLTEEEKQAYYEGVEAAKSETSQHKYNAFYWKTQSSKNTKLTKKADYTKEEIEMINKEKEKQIECGEMIWKAKNALYGNKVEECKEVVKQMPENCKLNFVVNVKREGEDKYYKKEINEIFKVIPQSLINEADEILKENPNILYVSEWYRKSSKTKAVKKQAKYEETIQGDEKVKDSAKSFGYDIKFAGHYGKWIYYYLIDEKGNIIRDDKEYQKVYDEMKKRIDDDIDIDNYAFAKGLIEEVDGELMRVPTIVISEYTLLSNHKDREENTGLEEFKRDFNLSSSTKKKAVLQESENGLGYVLPNGSVVYPGDEKYLQSELKGDKELLEKTKSEIVRLEKEMEEIKKEYPEVDLSKYPDSILFKLDRELKLKEAIELSIETIEDILNAFKNKKMGKQATKKTATIKHENGVYNVYSESGKCLGKGYKTKEEAEKRLKQVEYFKNKKSSLRRKAFLTQVSKEMVKDAMDIWQSQLSLYDKKYNTDEEIGKAEIEQKDKEYNFYVKWDYQYGNFMNRHNDTFYKLYKNQISIDEAVERINALEKQISNKRTSLKDIVISKMAKSLKDIPDSVKKNILSDLVYVILTGKGSFAYKTVAKKLETIIKELGYGDKLKANEDGSLPTMEIVELISKEPKAMELAGKFANITRAF